MRIGAWTNSRGGWDFGGQERRDQVASLALFYAKRGERNLSYCLYLRPFRRVNGLTAQLPILGAGLVGTTDEEWRNDFSALATAVRLIVVVPSAQPGTLWELSEIARNARWKKTLFVMPESVHSRDEQVVAAEWEETRKAASGVGVTLPPYDKNGAVFKLGPSGDVLGTRPLRLTQRLWRVSHLRRVINELRPL